MFLEHDEIDADDDYEENLPLKAKQRSPGAKIKKEPQDDDGIHEVSSFDHFYNLT